MYFRGPFNIQARRRYFSDELELIHTNVKFSPQSGLPPKAENTPLLSQSDLRAELQPLFDLRNMILRQDPSFAYPNHYRYPQIRMPNRTRVGYPLKFKFNNPPSISQEKLATRAMCRPQSRSGAHPTINYTSYLVDRSRSEAPVGSRSWI